MTDVRPEPTQDDASTSLAGARPGATGSASSVPDLTVDLGALGAVQAGEVVVSKGAVGAARADRIWVDLGVVGAAAAREQRVSTAAVGLALAQEAHFEQTVVRSVLAQRVTLGRGSAAAVVVALRSDGPGRPLLDWRGGLAGGLVLALAWLVVRRLR
jgi:hypothetical protein